MQTEDTRSALASALAGQPSQDPCGLHDAAAVLGEDVYDATSERAALELQRNAVQR
jgi:hypothetical protein